MVAPVMLLVVRVVLVVSGFRFRVLVGVGPLLV